MRIIGVQQATQIPWMLGAPFKSYDYVKRTVQTREGPVPVEDYVQGAEVPGSTIENLFDLDGQVHVVAQLADGRKRHLVIAYAAIAIILSGMEEGEYRKIMADTATWEPMTQVFDLGMKVWRVDGDVPIDDKVTITRIVRNGDEIEVYGAPKPGSPFAGHGYFQYRLMSVYWHAAESTIGPSAWEAIATDLAREAAGDLEDDEDDEDEDEIDDADAHAGGGSGAGGHVMPIAAGGAAAPPNGTTTPGAATS